MNFRGTVTEQLELNVTPLIDVVFLLLVFFMVSTTFQKETQLRLQLPQASDQKVEAAKRSIEVVISASGQYHVNGKKLADSQLTTVRKAINKLARGNKDIPLLVRADALAPHQSVVTAMDAAAQLGMVKFSLAAARSD